ncbi:unnamed protein product [Soboliphyme baturini]|uniref:Myosin_tail_1 domain-containing protein n=1 Tax=Soboliphyme baturini TaxID=241478 RepID=A0A183IH91_9BILA|nr:unnamed protein product [Soboliphyme baturini]
MISGLFARCSFQKFKDSFERLQNENEVLQREKEHLTSNVETAKREFDLREQRYTEEVESLRSSLSTLETEKGKLQKEVVSGKTQITSLSKELKDLKAQCEKLLEGENELNMKLAERDHVYNVILKEKSSLLQKIEALESNMNTANAEKKSVLKEDRSSVEGVVNDLREKLKAATAEFSTAMVADGIRKLIALRADIAEKKDEIKVLLEKCTRLEHDFDEKESECSNLQLQLDNATAAMHELGRENVSLQARLFS